MARHPGPPHRRARRPRPLLLGALATAALVVLVAWMRYDPVTGGGVTWCPDGTVHTTTPGEAAAPACTADNTVAGTISFGTAVRNTGWLPVVVREVRLRGEFQGVLRVEQVNMALRNDRTDVAAATLVPMRAFRLGPGEQRLVEVRGTLVPCEEVTNSRVVTFSSLPLRTSVLGLPHDSDAPLDPEVRLIAERC